MIRRSTLLRLLREGCNCAEIAAYFGVTDIVAQRAARLLCARLRRRWPGIGWPA